MSQSANTPGSGGKPVDLGAVRRAVPEPPSAELDPYLDAAQRCFQRFGLTRTSVPDIAREAGVSRSTIYRLVGPVGQVARMVFVRELHRFLAEVPEHLVGSSPPDVLIDLVTAFATRWIENPVVRRVVEDDLAAVGPELMREVPHVHEAATAIVAPMLEAARDAGLVADRDPRVLVSWISRIVFTVIVAPPEGDLRAFFAAVLDPVLRPPTP